MKHLVSIELDRETALHLRYLLSDCSIQPDVVMEISAAIDDALLMDDATEGRFLEPIEKYGKK